MHTTSTLPAPSSQHHRRRLPSPRKQPNNGSRFSTWFSFKSSAAKAHALPHHRKRSSSPSIKQQRQAFAANRARLKRRLNIPFPFLLVICFVLATVFRHQLRKSASSFKSSPRFPDLTHHVKLFRGTENGGNMFPGVVPAPFSVVKFGPDCHQEPPVDAFSGYLPAGNVTGFSLLHESGASGAPVYGVVSQMPVLGRVVNPLLNTSAKRMVEDYAEVGYFRSWLLGGIMVEMAGTDHAGLIKHSFQAGGFENSVVVDVSHVLQSFRPQGWSQNYIQGKFRLFEDSHYEGFGVYNGGWNLAPEFTIYFCGYFVTPPHSAETFSGVGERLSQLGQTNVTSGSERQGGVFVFQETNITSRIGVSWISSRKACDFVNHEIPNGTTIETLVQRSKDRWNREVLSKITVNPDANRQNTQQLYSNLYGMYISPSNRTGENPNWKSAEPYFDGIVTFWDLFRCAMALTQILTPKAHEEQLRSLLDIYVHDGWLPDARSTDWTGETQGGSNVDNILADAYVKGVKLNWTLAYKAMEQNARVVPPNNNDPRAPDSSTRIGRGALPDLEHYGYITPTYTRAVSRAVEYAANDFALHQVAKGLERPERESDFYLQRSRLWRNHYNPSQSSKGFSGFLAPRLASAEFKQPYDPLQCGGCSWMDPFYKGNAWEYTFAAGHHDMAAMINMSGGHVTFIRKLQKIFEQWEHSPNDAFNGTIINPASPPSFTTPYLFHFVNRQDLSVKYSRRMARWFYNPDNDGLPGPSASGAMQSLQLWNMIGLYPMIGQKTFLIGSPWFKSMSVDLGAGKLLYVTMTGGNVKNEEIYVQRVWVNGVYWTRNWLDWDDVFANGGAIHFEIFHTPIEWANGPVPPSPASEDQFSR